MAIEPSFTEFPNDTESLSKILAVIEDTGHDADRFAETLRHRKISHLSFSQISTVEFCEYRYTLEYIQLVDPEPIPLYFTKGKLLHEIIASIYRKNANGAGSQPVELEAYFDLIDRELDADHGRHLKNALLTHFQNRWQNAQVVSVEEPFAMILAPDLPPCVGVIDLVLKREGNYILIDHKTGRDFYAEDELQMAIYVEYMRRQFGEVACDFYYDHYRWVNHLDRIRKPAFQRNAVFLPASYWQNALDRVRSGYRIIVQLHNGKRANRNGECFRCPFRENCQKR